MGHFRGCLQGVHLSQVHQQSKKYTPKLHQQSKKYTGKATLVHLRQVHPLKAPTEQEVPPPKDAP